MSRIFIIVSILMLCTPCLAQRTVRNINSFWEFQLSGADRFENIHLPHTFNAQDAFEDNASYYRGKAIYRKVINTKDHHSNNRHFLRFKAVNQHAVVKVNGVEVGNHKGGYTSFSIDITQNLTFNSDTIIVEVDNSHDPGVPPLKGDFTFYGGIYRDVEWIEVQDHHFSMANYGSDGVYIHPVKIEAASANVMVEGEIAGPNPQGRQVSVDIYDAEGLLIGTSSATPMANGKWTIPIEVKNPRLWDVADPYLYRLECSLINAASGQEVDHLDILYGFRYFRFDADQGFFLNGKHTKLIGVNRHQDRPHVGNALTTDMHIDDMDHIKDLGVNYLRTAHYPQDQSILNYCDRAGIVTSMEIPLDHEISLTEEFAFNSKLMTLEMIHQNYNHPSVIIWAYMNEMGLGKSIQRDSMEMLAVAELAQELEDLIRKEDPYRYTMIPNHGFFEIYQHFGLTDIPMIVGWNLYHGWYEEDVEGFGKSVDHAHKQVPDKPIIITEYGAGADPRITSFTPERFDFSLDWSLKFHKAHIAQIMDRPFIAGSAVWNMYDFGSFSRQDAVPHINNKGLSGFDRKPKPVYFLYKALMSEENVSVFEALPHEILLPGTGRKKIPATIISSNEFAKVVHNGVESIYPMELNTHEAQLEIVEGNNHIALDDNEVLIITGYKVESYWQNKNMLHINMGTTFFYNAENKGSLWHPTSGIPPTFLKIKGGERFQPRDRGIGSDRSIALTDDDPIYQTMLEGIEEVQLFLPGGRYKLILHCANLNSERHGQQNIKIGSTTITVPEAPPFTAYTVSHTLNVESDPAILEFSTDSGHTFINGIQIIKW